MNAELPALADLARRLVASGSSGTLSTLFAVRGSTYRPLGSMMVSLPGVRAGGVSGGCLEEYIARIGERETRNRSAVMLQFATHPGDDVVPSLGCGGAVELLVERLTPNHVRLLDEFARAAGRDDASWLACVVRRDGQDLSVARDWLQSGETENVHKTIASDTDVLVQYVPPVTRLLIFGAGDDAKPLCDIGASLGWHVSVADRRARFATRSRFPRARTVVTGEWDETVDALTFSGRTAAVLMTHSLDDDARVLSLLSGKPLAYLGALGPRHRRVWLLEQAWQLEGRRDERLEAILHGPIGLDLGDRSAAGIAVAVLAEILAHMNRRSAQPLYGWMS
jgi:xanthine/CO dehydrogenase XdhC/CoxF family maturation factor